MTRDQAKLAAKKAVLSLRIAEGYAVVHVRLDREAVIAPRYLFVEPTASFLLSPTEARNIEIGEERISASLAFDGRDFTCSFPYTHIWGVTNESGETVLFREDAPPEILSELDRAAKPATLPQALASQPAPARSAEAPADRKETKRPAPFLKRIK